MGVTMYLQQKLNPAPTDPVQARVFQFLPNSCSPSCWARSRPALVIYWGVEQHAVDRPAVTRSCAVTARCAGAKPKAGGRRAAGAGFLPTVGWRRR